MSQPNINTPNSDLVSSLSQSQSYLSPNFLVILPGLTSSVRLCGVERCPAQQSEEEEEEFWGNARDADEVPEGYAVDTLEGGVKLYECDVHCPVMLIAFLDNLSESKYLVDG